MKQKPSIGFLGITQELYDDVVPGITAHQEEHVRRLMAAFNDEIDFTFHGPAKNRSLIESHLDKFGEAKLDGILVVMLTYAPSLFTIRGFLNNKLPILLANIQPERTVARTWTMANLTYNQGIHGAQDLGNCLLTLGVDTPVLSGDWQSPAFRKGLTDWAHAARTAAFLKTAKIATFGQMPGMGDITTDPNDIMKTIGTQVDHVSVGSIIKNMESVPEAEVEAAVKLDHEHFAVSPSLPAANHRYAARLYLGFKRFIREEGYQGFCVHFDALGLDGRFRQIHMLAASNLMAEGYGYAAEGDVLCASLMSGGQVLSDNAHFTEMYAMDFDRNAFLMSHMGEGNWKISRRDRKPALIDRELRIGGLDNPPTVLFSAEPGPATLASLAAIGKGKFRMVVTEGEILDDADLSDVEMPYFFFRPDTGRVEDNATAWIEKGGTHHQTLHLGRVKNRWKLLCRILGIEYTEIS